MLSSALSVLLLPLLAAMFLAINMGASGTAPSFSAAFGSNLIRRERIPALFGIFVFLGALLAGKKVVLTIGQGIFPAEMMGMQLTTIILVSIGLSMLLANVSRVPQSTSQSTVFALAGVAVYFGVLKTDKLLYEIIPLWFVTPVIAFAVSWGVGRFVYPVVRDCGIVDTVRLAGTRGPRYLVIAAACYVAFAIGSNNVANAAGPIASMLTNELSLDAQSRQFDLIVIVAMLMVAPCFAIGSSLLGARVISTTGKDIVEFGPLGAVLISVVTATLLLMASVTKGIPLSLVQLNAGAIIGLGISKVGFREILGRASVRGIFVIWIVSPLVALFLALGITAGADGLGLLG